MRIRALLLTGGLGFLLALALIGVLNLGLAPAEAAIVAQSPAAQTGELDLEASKAISRAVIWLGGQQMANGGFGDAGVTADVVLGLAAAGLEPRLMVSGDGRTPLDFLASEALTYTAQGPGEAAKLALAVEAANADPAHFAGLNLIEMLQSSYDQNTGVFAAVPFTDTNIYDQALAILALAAGQNRVPDAAVEALLGWQGGDGGWEFSPGAGWGSDPDSTALAIMALLASGGDVAPQIQQGLDFLRLTQLESGGWGWEAASPDSTGLVIQALAAAGLGSSALVTPARGDPQSELIGLQLPAGAFPDWQGAPSVMATAHALPGLAAAPFPVWGRALLAERAVTWVVENQQEDGGFGNASDTADAMVALAAAGYDPASVLSREGNSPLEFLATQVLSYSHDGGEVGKLVLAAVAAKTDPRHLGGHDLILMLTEHLSPTGQFNTDSNFKQALALLALDAADAPIPAEALQWLKDQQLEDGSWEWAAGGGWGGDPDTTAIVVQALVAVGEPVDSAVLADALAYLRQMQNPDAGFKSSFDPMTNANTTAYVVQALLAAGEDLLHDWSVAGRTPLDALQSFAKADGPLVYQWGGFLGPADNLVATIQAAPALLGRPLPLRPLAAGEATGQYAGVVVDYNGLTGAQACVSLPAEPVSGIDLLEASGIPFEETPDGLVCKIGKLGCSAEDCFCGGSFFWSYWYQDASGWQSYPVGAGGSQVTAGTVDGWRWSEWTPNMSGPGTVPSMVDLCASTFFHSVNRGLDPDQLVPVPFNFVSMLPGDGGLEVAAPAGFDANQDAVAALLYRPVEGTEWISVTLSRGDTVFTATLPIENPADYVFQIQWSDPDGVRAFWLDGVSDKAVTESVWPPGEPEPIDEPVVEEPTLEPVAEPTEAPPELAMVPTEGLATEAAPVPAEEPAPEPEQERLSPGWLIGLGAAFLTIAAGLWWRKQQGK